MPVTAPHQRPKTPLLGGEELRDAMRAMGPEGTGDGRLPEMVALLERAVTETYRRLVPEDIQVEARVDLVAGAVSLVRVTDDGVVRVEDEPQDFTRQAAQAARAAIAGWVQEAERVRVVREATAYRGELLDAVAERPDDFGRSGRPAWWLRSGPIPLLLPPEEQLPGEQITHHQHLKVMGMEIRRGREAVLLVSRTHPGLLRRLLEQEIPELTTGQVTIESMAREAGRRSKVAVRASDSALDPVGACIGPKGVRHRAVVAELGEEQLHVVPWSTDPSEFVAHALRPATVLDVELLPESRTAHVVVAADQLSLAIGRSGENARLAARLTGWRIDISARETVGEDGSDGALRPGFEGTEGISGVIG